jgi:hypothetical protein
VNWSRRFGNPVPMPDGSTIRTIGEAAEYAIRRPKKARNTEPWQRAAKGLQLAAEHGGPFVFMARRLLQGRAWRNPARPILARNNSRLLKLFVPHSCPEQPNEQILDRSS